MDSRRRPWGNADLPEGDPPFLVRPNVLVEPCEAVLELEPLLDLLRDDKGRRERVPEEQHHEQGGERDHLRQEIQNESWQDRTKSPTYTTQFSVRKVPVQHFASWLPPVSSRDLRKTPFAAQRLFVHSNGRISFF